MLYALSSSLHRAVMLAGAVYLAAIAVVALLGCILVFFAARAAVQFSRYHSRRYVLCPGTGQAAAIRIDALKAAMSGLLDSPKLVVGQCTNWPARRDCRQACLHHLRS